MTISAMMVSAITVSEMTEVIFGMDLLYTNGKVASAQSTVRSANEIMLFHTRWMMIESFPERAVLTLRCCGRNVCVPKALNT
jgi:hypothetical protein